MVSYGEYLRGVLEQVLESYHTLRALDDRPGTLDAVNREISRINGLLRAVSSRLESASLEKKYPELYRLSTRYVETYSFSHEIEAIGSAYAQDPNRIRNVRLKILESLDESRIAASISNIMDDL